MSSHRSSLFFVLCLQGKYDSQASNQKRVNWLWQKERRSTSDRPRPVFKPLNILLIKSANRLGYRVDSCFIHFTTFADHHLAGLTFQLHPDVEVPWTGQWMMQTIRTNAINNIGLEDFLMAFILIPDQVGIIRKCLEQFDRDGFYQLERRVTHLWMLSFVMAVTCLLWNPFCLTSLGKKWRDCGVASAWDRKGWVEVEKNPEIILKKGKS